MNPVVRTLFSSITKRLDKKNRTVTFVGTKETPDRTGDIVRAGGIELENFGKNSVFLWNHNSDIPAIGKITSVTHSGNGLLFDVKFDGPEVDEFADQIFQKFVSGTLSAVSIGFIPKDIEPIFSNQGELVGLDILRSELLELSAVNIPAHQDALAAGMDKKYTHLLDSEGEKALNLEEYRKTLEGTFTQEEQDMQKLEDLEATVKVLEESMSDMSRVIDEQAETIKSLISLRETVDLSKQVMDTLNKSIVSLMSEKKLPSTPGSEGDGSTPHTPSVDPSALLKTLDNVLSRFQQKAFTVKGEK